MDSVIRYRVDSLGFSEISYYSQMEFIGLKVFSRGRQIYDRVR